MPLYTDQGYYYSGGSSQLYAPYYTPGLYTTPATSSSSSSYAPYSSTYNRTFGGSYILPLTPPRTPTYTTAHSLASRYQPKLSTITETSALISSRHGGTLPLTRIHSPKVSSYTAATTTNTAKYVPPRPIPINTADIDVSSSRYQHHKDEKAENEKLAQQDRNGRRNSIEKKEQENTEAKEESKVQENRGRRSTIKRDRPVVRLSTIRSRSKDRNRATKSTSSGTDDSPETKSKVFKDLPTIEPLHTTETHISWRQKLADELAAAPIYPAKKSPGDLIRERYLIQDALTADLNKTEHSKEAAAKSDDNNLTPLTDEVVIELDVDPTNNTIRRLSIPQCPTFHDICKDISSDKIDDDLNAGELRRRASLIQEQEQEILNQLQKSASGTFQLIHLERRDSHDSQAEEDQRQSTKKRKSKKGKKIRHKITAVVEVENSPFLPVLQEKEELCVTPAGKSSSPKPKFTFNVESMDEHHEINTFVKLPKRKSVKRIARPKEVILPEGFMQASPKTKAQLKTKSPPKKKTFVSTAEIFTFEPSSIDLYAASNVTPSEIVENKCTKIEADTKISPKPTIQPVKAKALTPLKTSNSLDSALNKSKADIVLSTLEKSQSLDATNVGKPPELLTPVVSIPKVGKSKTEIPKVEAPKVRTTKVGAQTAETPKGGSSHAEKSKVETPKVETPKVETPKAETPKVSSATGKESQHIAVEKSDSGEDFWAQIGKRESVYMTNRKKSLIENQWQKCEELLESEAVEDVNNIEEIKSVVTAQKNEALKKADQDMAKINDKGVVGRSQSTESNVSSRDKKVPKNSKVSDKMEQREVAAKKPLATTTQKSSVNIKLETENLTTTTPITTASSNATAAATSAASKINSGQAAKSPEQEPNKFTTQVNNDNDSESNVKADKPILFISQTNTATKQTATSTKTTATEIQTPTTPKSITPTAEGNLKVAEKLATSNEAQVIGTTIEANTKPTVSGGNKPEARIAAPKEVNVKSDSYEKKNVGATLPTTPTLAPPTLAASTAPGVTGTKPKTAPKSIATTTKPQVTKPIGKSKASPRSAPPVTPINADQFISVAPPKSATSPTKTKTTSPQNTKAKGKQTTTPLANRAINKEEHEKEKVTKTKISPKTTATAAPPSVAVMPKVATTAVVAITATTTTTATKLPNATTTTTTTSSTSPESATAPIISPPPVPVATELLARRKSHEDAEDDGENNHNKHQQAHAPNNLSKFATVQNLAQCLQDVDADLEDYIPSSAENSDDEDSSDNYSSVDGCDYQNLSASMKKKVRQRRKKEKQAEQARFDPQKKIKIDPSNKCYVKEEAPRYPLVATPRPLWKREKIVYPVEDSDDESGDSDESGSGSEETEDSEECTTSEEYEDDLSTNASSGAATGSNVSKENSAIIRLSTCSNDSGFEGGTAPSSPKKMLETSYTYSQFQKSGRFTAPATVIPRFKNYSVDDFHFLAVLGKGSFGKVLLAELRDTTYYYAVKCLKKDVVLEDDDVDSTLIERKVLALGTKHPYLCHLFCTFQTESHLFFVMEYLNGGDLMFHIQESGRFPEERARFYGAEIISGLKFLHKKGIIYRDLKLDNVLLDFEGHVRIADFGMCKLQIYLDKTADSFCGTPDYMAPEIIKGEKYNQYVDWWSFGVLLYEMLIGQSPFSGCDEDELFWSICNEIPWFPVYISAEATGILKGLLEKDYTKRIGSQYSPAGDISEHIFFRPIDWDLLEKRQLPPPFKPLVKHPLDTQYFDRVFTKERVRLTPIEKDILQSMDQKPFLGFTYTNPHITLD
ncbi:mucin-4 isoform X2 [Ceratitis capitata]|uniref:mucin-4 isoform X2 n=1 Tax=Ceratitis capitata TaxID=7213 RepID=UPI00032A31B7|nr:mucin-4 isoform X2 [Ceratitis capitata]